MHFSSGFNSNPVGIEGALNELNDKVRCLFIHSGFGRTPMCASSFSSNLAVLSTLLWQR